MKYLFALLILPQFFVLSHHNQPENTPPKEVSQYTDPFLEPIKKEVSSPTVKPINEILPKISTVVSPLDQNRTVDSCFENECDFNGSCVKKPENAYCVLDNPKNAWLCEYGYLDTGDSCISEAKGCGDNKCKFKSKCFEKPLNAHCVTGDTKNAWLCDYGFLEHGNSCVPLVQGCPTKTCKFKGKCIDKPNNAYCITETATDAWKCLSGYNDTGKDCVPKKPSTVSYSNVYTASNNNITERNINKYYCQNLTTTEAYSLFLRGHTYLDADNDGIPCEWESLDYSNYYYTPIPTYKSLYTYPSSSCHYVKAYTRSNGTRVNGYTRCR